MTAGTDRPRCTVCGNGMHSRWGTTVPEEERAAIEIDGRRYPVHRGCIGAFVARPEDDSDAWASQQVASVAIGEG